MIQEADQDCSQELFKAVKSNDLTTIKSLRKERNIPKDQYDMVLHKAAEKNKISVVYYLVKHQLSNPNFQNEKKQTALHIAAIKGFLEIFVLLKFSGANVLIKDEDSKCAIEYLDNAQKERVCDLLQKYSSKTTVSVLLEKTEHMALGDNVKSSTSFLDNMYTILYGDEKHKKDHAAEMKEYTRPILQVAANVDLKIFVEPNERTVDAVEKMAKTKGRLGVFYSSGKIIVGTLNELKNKASERSIMGTLIHELCHNTAFHVFNNKCNPYKANDPTGKQIFDDICKELEGKQDTLDDILRRVFTLYESKDHHSELIVRVPQMVAEYGKEGVERLHQQAPKLLKYYYDEFLPPCKQYCKNRRSEVIGALRHNPSREVIPPSSFFYHPSNKKEEEVLEQINKQMVELIIDDCCERFKKFG